MGRQAGRIGGQAAARWTLSHSPAEAAGGRPTPTPACTDPWCDAHWGVPGGNDFASAADYITQRFAELNRSPDKKTVYPHLTCATDTDNIRFVWAAVNDIVTRTALRRAGLM